MVYHIPLSQGKEAVIDDNDLALISPWNWSYQRASTGQGGYAVGNVIVDGKRRRVTMHQWLLTAPPGMEVDHKNGDKLDNRRQNLRLATHQQNMANKGTPPTNRTGYKGVLWRADKRKFSARIKCNGKARHLGYFATAQEAARAYNAAAAALFGEFAHLNEVER